MHRIPEKEKSGFSGVQMALEVNVSVQGLTLYLIFNNLIRK